MTLPWTVDDLPRILVMLIIAAIIGWISDLFAGGRVPLGFFGAVVFGLVGAWLASSVVRPRIPFTLPNEPILDQVPVVTACIGAFAVSLAWCLLASRLTRRLR
ncbi:MAG: GlsB/YeaQ/YmgE family stress response membrane protein [Chloroflexia bacterium]